MAETTLQGESLWWDRRARKEFILRGHPAKRWEVLPEHVRGLWRAHVRKGCQMVEDPGTEEVD